MSKTKWCQKGIYVLIALALLAGIPFMPRAAASPDHEATFFSTNSDGYLHQNGYNYSDVHAANLGAVANTTTELWAGQWWSGWSGLGFLIFRGALFFDTSPLPDDACITSATLFLYGREDHSDTEFQITVVNGTGLGDSLVDTDYGYLGSQNVSGGAFDTIGFNISGYNDIPLNETGMGWISKTGTTKLGLRSSRDSDAIAPTDYEFVAVYASEEGEGRQPKLVVTYTIPPVAAFNATPTSGCAPLTVKFTDLSTGPPASWSWTFGDGGTSTDQNPSHKYASRGTYTVGLTVTNDCGPDSTTKADFITVSESPPVGGEAYPVNKVSLPAPWIAAGIFLAGGLIWYALRRRRAQS